MSQQRQQSRQGWPGRPGYFALLALVGVLALTMTVAAIATHFKERVRASGDAVGVALARLQVLYLAEMGVNAVMFQANLAPEAPHPALTSTTLDFKAEVSLVRAEPAGEALVLVGPATPRAGRPPYAARATLTCPAGTYVQTVYFDIGRAPALTGGLAPPQWTLTRYVVEELGAAP